MEYMFKPGFLGTEAPFFMDITTIVVALLPLLLGIAIALARHKAYKAHRRVQTAIFIVSVIVVGYFEYGVRISGGFAAFLENSSVSHGYLKTVLGLHIVIAVVTLGLWAATLRNAYKDADALMLPGIYSRAHKKAGLRTFWGVSATSLTGIWVYLLLFVS
jgi:putative membrane protein